MEHKVLLSFACILLYFFPCLITAARHTAARKGIFLFNLFFGWTVIGWWVAIALATTGKTRQQAERSRDSQTLAMIWAHHYE